ncbi:MAG: ribonuclease HII [Alphaproteobacteria bacterium]
MTPTERLCGVDEVGRGPLAGPVVAAAVVLDPARPIAGLADSKTLRPARRIELAALIHRQAEVAIAAASVDEIDRLNILQASLLAMARAVAALPRAPCRALIDGKFVPARLPCPAEAVVRGDASVPAIAAASIVAKVYRDKLMTELAAAHPGFGWEANAGYPTAQHLAALRELGPSPTHRRSFGPVKVLLSV